VKITEQARRPYSNAPFLLGFQIQQAASAVPLSGIVPSPTLFSPVAGSLRRTTAGKEERASKIVPGSN
jgi:hypothetical protein